GPITDAQGGVMIGNDEGGGEVKKWFFANGGNTLLFHINNPGLGSVFLVKAPFTPSLQQWYHFAVVRRGTMFSIFTNGIIAGAEASAIEVPNPSAPLTIGRSEGLYFNGRIDEVGIYNRALTPQEILAIFNSGASGKCTVASGPFLFVQLTNQALIVG